MTDQPKILQQNMQAMRDQCDELMQRIEQATAFEARTVFRELFTAQAQQFERDAAACRETAIRLQAVSDAMRAKLGTVAA